MAEKITWEQIKSKYPSEWVMLVNYKFSNDISKVFPSEGEVVAHAKSRKEFSELMMQYPATDFSVRFTGQISDGMQWGIKILFLKQAKGLYKKLSIANG